MFFLVRFLPESNNGQKNIGLSESGERSRTFGDNIPQHLIRQQAELLKRPQCNVALKRLPLCITQFTTDTQFHERIEPRF